MTAKRIKIKKVLLSVLLTLLIIVPSTMFIIYPQYTNLRISITSFDITDITKNSWLSFLISVSPVKKDIRGEMIFTTDSIEETVSDFKPLKEKILEELNTYLIIPSINVEGIVVEGTSSKDMDRGFWHFPSSKYPGEKGNCVIIGHRFEFLPPAKNTFYNLDKIHIGDNIIIQQENNNSFTYIVTNIEVVEKNDISILKDTSDYRLTLITCTPLWTSQQRLVITAKMDRIYNKS